MSLIQDWSLDAGKKFPPHPYLALHIKDGKQLLFLAAKHGTSQIAPETFRMIEKTFNDFNPDAVVVEAGNMTPERILRATEMSAESETLFTISLASGKDVPVLAGELNESEINATLLKENYSPKDLIRYYILRQAQVLIRDKKISSVSDFAHAIENRFGWILERMPELGIRTMPSFETFKQHWEKTTGKPFHPPQITSDDLAPLKDGTFFQRLSYRIGLIRNTHLLSVLENAVNKFNTILVVYGGSHYTEIQKALNTGIPFSRIMGR